jgi:EpsI family protein
MPVVTSRAARRLVAPTLCLVLTWLYVAAVFEAEVVPGRRPLAELPMQIGDWRGWRDADFDAQVVAVLGVDDYIVRTYALADGLPVGLYIGYYATQRHGDTIHSPLNCLPGAGWQPVRHDRIPISGSGIAGRVEVNRVLIQKGLDRALVIYWYQTHRRVTASEYWGKIYTVLDAVRENRTDAALVRLIAPLGDGGQALEDADRRARTFAYRLLQVIGDYLPA